MSGIQFLLLYWVGLTAVRHTLSQARPNKPGHVVKASVYDDIRKVFHILKCSNFFYLQLD